jgi:DNA-binding ferritin-like protein
VEGPLFLPVHKFLKKQYFAHVDQFDQVTEFVRTMDTLLPMCEKGLLNAYKGFKHVKSYDMREMLITYLGNLEKVGMQAKEIGEMAREVQAPDVENYMADLVGPCSKPRGSLKPRCAVKPEPTRQRYKYKDHSELQFDKTKFLVELSRVVLCR